MRPRPMHLLVLLALPTLDACSGSESRSDAVSTASDVSTGAAVFQSRAPLADGARRQGFGISGSGADDQAQEKVAAPTPATPVAARSTANAQATQLPGTEALATAMLIRTGQASVRVDSLGVGVARVRELARRVGALVANTSVTAGEEQRGTATIELRVPSDRFDELVNGLSPLGKVEAVNVEVQDVGEEYTDVAARVANARRLEARLIELLANRTGKLADVLTVERELARIREEIERYEGRMRYLRTRVSYSSLTVTVHERLPIVSAPPGRHPIVEAVRDAWRNFVWVVAVLIASMGVLVPIAVIVGGAWVMAKKVRGTRTSVLGARPVTES